MELVMNRTLHFALSASALVFAVQAAAQVTFYEGEGFRGRTFTASKQVWNFEQAGFNDRASSAVVERGRWEVCENARFEGRCVLLRPGSYDSLNRMGMNDRVSSVRPADGKRQYDNQASEPLAAPNYEYRRRPNERTFTVPITSAHAVVGPPEQRCWMERQQVQEPMHREPNVGGAVIGAVIGGILGHQVGGGSGKTLATVGGAVAGGAVGANVGRGQGGGYSDRDVQRCENTASRTPEYWDVSYSFRGVDHHVQMSTPPGPTIAVNRNGEPRG
jgi:uncharacterized protein YcfJ